MRDPGWKQVERKVAVYLGGRRNPTSGGNAAHSRSDALLPSPLYIETKHGKHAERLLRSPKRLARLLEDTEEKALAENKVAVVVLHPNRWGNGGVANYPAFVRLEVSRPDGRASGLKSDPDRPALLLGVGTIACVPLSAVRAAIPNIEMVPRA